MYVEIASSFRRLPAADRLAYNADGKPQDLALRSGT